MATGRMKVGLCSVLALCTAGAVGNAQDRGGVTLQFGVSQSFEHLRRSNTDPTTQALTGLSFLYVTETRTDRLTFSAGLSLRAVDGPGRDGIETEVLNPNLGVSYTRTGAAASLSFSANYVTNDISFIRPLSDFVDADGFITLPEDFDDLNGTGTRENLSYSARVTLLDDRPFGISLSASVAELNYTDTSDPDLVDTTRVEVGAGLRFDINDVTQANVSLSHTQLETQGSADSSSTSLSAAVTLSQPTGSLSFGLTASETDSSGTQVGFSVSRELDLSETAGLSAELGVTRPAEGGTVVTGGLSYRQTLADGAISASVNRTVSVDSDDGESVVTSLGAGYSTALTPDLSLSLSAAFARSSETATDVDTDVADLGLQLSYDLTQDWALSAGVSRQWRTEDPGATTTTDTISVGLSRTFQWRY